jgi:hypothetical protein
MLENKIEGLERGWLANKSSLAEIFHKMRFLASSVVNSEVQNLF